MKPLAHTVATSNLHRIFLALIATSFASVYGDEKSESDPWFDDIPNEAIPDEEAKESESDEDSSSATVRARSPKYLYTKVMANYEAIPEGNLSKRISTLEEAVTVAPNLSGEAKSQLEILRRQKNAILAALEEANAMDTFEALPILRPHIKYFASDPDLAIAFVDSPFVDRLNQQIRILGKNGEIEELTRLDEEARTHGIDRILGKRFDSSTQNALTGVISERWNTLTRNQKLMPGESYLVGQLLQSSEHKLRLQLDLPEDMQPILADKIVRNFKRHWGTDFEISRDDGEPQAPELVLSVNAKRVDFTISESESNVASSVPGKVIEEPNPEFMELAAKYEKEAKRYETAMEMYEINYERYLVSLEGGEDYNTAQRNLENAERDYQAATPATREYDASFDEAQIAASVAASVTQTFLPQPLKPEPFHLRTLEKLYAIPSTLVVSMESTPYEYRAKKLNYTFASQAGLNLRTPVNRSLNLNGISRLEQSRSWTRNEGVHRSDPTADQGTFSQTELDSAIDLFSLEFASACSKEFGILLEKASRSNADLQLLGHSLRAQQRKENLLAATTEELTELAKLARSPDLTASQLRRACLELIFEKSGAGEFEPGSKL